MSSKKSNFSGHVKEYSLQEKTFTSSKSFYTKLQKKKILHKAPLFGKKSKIAQTHREDQELSSSPIESFSSKNFDYEMRFEISKRSTAQKSYPCATSSFNTIVPFSNPPFQR